MRVIQQLAVFAVRDLLPGALAALGLECGAAAVRPVAAFLTDHLTDQSERLGAALDRASGRAWRAVEIALAGESLWSRLDRAEDRALRRQLVRFLDTLLPGQMTVEAGDFRTLCLQELRAARQAGLLPGGPVDLSRLVAQGADLARHADPQAQFAAEEAALHGVAGQLGSHGYRHLGRLLALRPADGAPLLVVAFRYFFRRAVEEDAQLFQGLAWARWEALARDQQRGFARLEEALADQGHRLERGLDQVLAEVRGVHTAALDVRAEQRRQGARFDELYRVILDVRRRLDDPARADSLAPDGDEERRLLRAVLARYRALSAEQQRQLPALLAAVADLLLRAGDTEEAERSYQVVAAVVHDRAAQAEAHYHAFRAAAGRQHWERALDSYRRAADLDGQRWTRERLRQELRDAVRGASPESRAALRDALARRRGRPDLPTP